MSWLLNEINVNPVPLAHPNAEDAGDSPAVVSPFAQTTSTVSSRRGGGGGHWALWIVSTLLVLVVIGVVGFFTFSYLEDPYRTLEVFPIDKYMDDYRSLSGARFKGDFKVANDLGYKDGVGRLMVFTMDNQSRPIVVLMPPKLAGVFFMKGQTYRVSLEVGEGGLIYADSCEKE